MTVESLLADVRAWALGEASVKAVLLVGSHARNEARKDSDVDLVIMAENPDFYTHDATFVNRFGTCMRSTREDYGKLVSIRAFYDHDLEVEFGITSPDWASLPLDAGTRGVLSDGYKILVDKNNSLQEVAEHIPQQPD